MSWIVFRLWHVSRWWLRRSTSRSSSSHGHLWLRRIVHAASRLRSACPSVVLRWLLGRIWICVSVSATRVHTRTRLTRRNLGSAHIDIGSGHRLWDIVASSWILGRRTTTVGWILVPTTHLRWHLLRHLRWILVLGLSLRWYTSGITWHSSRIPGCTLTRSLRSHVESTHHVTLVTHSSQSRALILEHSKVIERVFHIHHLIFVVLVSARGVSITVRSVSLAHSKDTNIQTFQNKLALTHCILLKRHQIQTSIVISTP